MIFSQLYYLLAQYVLQFFPIFGHLKSKYCITKQSHHQNIIKIKIKMIKLTTF